MKYDEISIPTYVINLPERVERRQSIEKEFKGRKEFELHIVEATRHEIGAVGLWKSIKGIIQEVVSKNEDDVIIICEDDHIFTESYQRDLFISQICRAAQLNTQILFGGIGGYENAVKISDDMFWIDWNWSTQFMVVFKPAFEKILKARFTKRDVADEFLSKIISNKIVLYPFISRQKDFGYSDVTASNNNKGHIEDLFDKTEARLRRMMDVFQKYLFFDDI